MFTLKYILLLPFHATAIGIDSILHIVGKKYDVQFGQSNRFDPLNELKMLSSVISTSETAKTSDPVLVKMDFRLKPFIQSLAWGKQKKTGTPLETNF